MITTKPKAILFDWDSTLAQTRETVIKALEQTLAHFHQKPWEKIKHLRQPLLSLKDNFPLIFGQDSQDAYRFYLKVYQPELSTASGGATEFLTTCLSENIDLYIISNKEKSLLQTEVSLCYPNIPFKKILAHGDAKANKPSAEPVKEALKDVPYPINPQNVWLIGDSLPDSECAYNANIQPIIIGHNITDKTYLSAKRVAIPKLIELENFTETLTLLKDI